MSTKSVEILELLSGAIEEVANGASQFVVRVGSDRRVGSGVVWNSEGMVATAGHIVHGLEEVEVGFSDGREAAGKVVGRDPYSDLALLKVDVHGARPAPLGDSEGLRIGQFVLALANPSTAGVGATYGIITGVKRDVGGWWRFRIDDAIVTDARLNPGYSGGPLVDARGRMVGMNVAYVSNRGVAVPVNAIRKAAERIMRGEPARRAYLGIVSDTIPIPKEIATSAEVGQGEGLMVLSVEPESAAKNAGLALGDVILKFDGRTVTSHRDLWRLLGEEAIGRATRLAILRGEKVAELTVTPSAAEA